MATATINISIPETMKAEVEEIIEDEGYGNTSEFFRDLVRNHIKQRQERKLEALLLEGLNSGPATPWTGADIEAVRERTMKRIGNKLNKKSK